MSNEHVFRGLLVRGVTLKGEPKAAVFAGQKRLHVATGPDVDSAVAAARGWIDALFAESAKSRPAPEIATTEEYVRYFAQHPPAGHEVAMLKAHAEAPHHDLTATQLAAAAGWNDFGPANLHYGYLGRMIGEALGLTFRLRSDDSPIYVSTLAADANAETMVDGQHRWRMHAELVDALVALGIATP